MTASELIVDWLKDWGRHRDISISRRARDDLTRRVASVLKEVEKDTWNKAAFECFKCSERLNKDPKAAPEGFYGAFDLIGLGEDFKANADGVRVPDADREKK